MIWQLLFFDVLRVGCSLVYLLTLPAILGSVLTMVDTGEIDEAWERLGGLRAASTWRGDGDGSPEDWLARTTGTSKAAAADPAAQRSAAGQRRAQRSAPPAEQVPTHPAQRRPRS
jgi:hypothetical protein